MSQSPFPQNLPYVQGHPNSPGEQKKQRQKGEGSSSQFLLERIQDLQKQLSALNALLTEDGGYQQAFRQLQQQNEQLKALLGEQQGAGEARELQISNQLLKENLLKQNEEMEALYQELVEARNSHSRVQERGQSEYLQSKVQELNDQISTLLLKIQQLVDQNNERQNSQEELSLQFESALREFGEKEGRLRNLQVENQILKEQIHNMEEISISQQKQIQDRYMREMEDLAQQIDELKSTLQKRPGQIRGNTERTPEDRAKLEEEISMLRSELASKNEQLLWQQENQGNLRRKWEERMVSSENQMRTIGEEANRLRAQLRREENKRSELQFTLQQQQKDRERLHFYKNNYSDSEQLRSTIVRMQAEKEELRLRAERLQVQLSQAKFEPAKHSNERSSVYGFMHQQAQDQLQRSKKLNKELKAAIGKYQEDYRSLRREFQKLFEEKCQAERFVQMNQLQLSKHRAVYEQLISRYNQTAALYKQVEAKLKVLEGERSQRTHHLSYDKEDIQLVKLENSALRQEIQYLKQQLVAHASSGAPGHIIEQLKEQCAQSKRRQRECAQQLQTYRQKYLRELEKSKGERELQRELQRASDLQEKLSRVNRMLNEKLKEVQFLQSREQDLVKEVEQAYLKCRMQFDNYGVRHHPEVKKLQTELLSAQRQIMESEFAFKQQINSCQDQLRLSRLQSQHHRAKIDQLLLQLNRERNSLDYSKLMRSLELSSLTEKDLRSQLGHKDQLINHLRQQLQKSQSKERSRPQSSLKSQLEELKLEKERQQQQLFEQESKTRELAQLLNSLQPKTSSEDTLKRAITFITQLLAGSGDHSEEDIQARQGSFSRYDQLARKKAAIARQFKQSQKFLYQESGSGWADKNGSLQRLRQNVAT